MSLHLSRFINPNINPASSRKRKKNTCLVLQIRSKRRGLLFSFFFSLSAAESYEQIGQESASKSLMQLSNSWINMFFSQRALSTIYPLIKTSLGEGEMRNARGGTKFTLLWECVCFAREGKRKTQCVCVCCMSVKKASSSSSSSSSNALLSGTPALSTSTS